MRRLRAPVRLAVSDCEAVRLAVSAMLDGEPAGLPAGVVDEHLAGCLDCRRFRIDATALCRLLALRAAAEAPPALGGAVGAQLAARPRASVGERARSWWRRAAPSAWPNPAQWVGAVGPAAVLATALGLGVPGHFDVVPSYVRTPCTSHLPAACRDGRCARSVLGDLPRPGAPGR